MSGFSLVDCHEEIVREDGKIYETCEQVFPDIYWKGLDWAREQDRNQRCPDLWRVASVPVVFIHKMYKDGLDIDRAPLSEIIGWLKRNHLDDFIVTDKRIY